MTVFDRSPGYFVINIFAQWIVIGALAQALLLYHSMVLWLLVYPCDIYVHIRFRLRNIQSITLTRIFVCNEYYVFDSFFLGLNDKKIWTTNLSTYLKFNTVVTVCCYSRFASEHWSGWWLGTEQVTGHCLTHSGRVTHICVSDLTSIGSDNGLSPGRRQAIIRTNAWILLIRHLGTNFSEFFVEIIIFSFKKMRLKVSSAKWRPFCLDLNELNQRWPG